MNGPLALLAATAFLTSPARAAVDISITTPQTTQTPEGEQFVQSVTFANDVAHYTLTYDITKPTGKENECTSHWWAWTTKLITLGMTEPSRANWYFQAFFNWYFDGESLYNRPATMKVIRQSGEDGVVEYTWDTPKATAHLRFAMATGSDKLLLFARYEPKQPINQSYLVFTCYPTGFAEPRNRAVTTATRTAPMGDKVTLDLAQERWVLYEDTTEGRPGNGPAGLLLGTPEAFSEVTVPVGNYAVTTRLNLKPEARSFALGLYSFPVLPDLQQTREYFRASATQEAEWLGTQAADDLVKPLPPLPLPESRRQALRQASARLFDRGVETWAPSREGLDFPWARKLPGGPVRALILTPRWCAYETMELARRLELEAKHLYFDTRTVLSSDANWPYRAQTGQGPVGMAAATMQAAELCSDPSRELFLVAGVSASALPGVSRTALLDQVRTGKGLLVVGSPDLLRGWPAELFGEPAPDLAEPVVDSFPYQQLPGYREGARGRIDGEAPLRAYRYGKGTVMVLRVGLGTYSSLVPRNDASEGLSGATDRCLALCASAALGAAGRAPTGALRAGALGPGSTEVTIDLPADVPQGSKLLVRLQDELDRVLHANTVALPLGGRTVALPAQPTGRRCFLDAVLLDEGGRTLAFTSAALPESSGPALRDLTLQPADPARVAAVPQMEAADGGVLNCSVAVEANAPLADTRLVWEVWDAFDRLLTRTETAVPANGGAVSTQLTIGPPVTVCHRLDVSLRTGERERAFARQRFTVALPYPYDDFTVLMWSYAGGDPVLQQTDRLCYDLGADMMDLCHMGGYRDEGAAREYALAARSGLRVLPYVTRLSGETTPDSHRVPCLHDPVYLDKTREALAATCRQAAPYSPVAFTLGDENYLFRGTGECCSRPESVAAFRDWLRDKYGTLDKLNQAWATKYTSFDALGQPRRIGAAAQQIRAAAQTTSVAPWLDHKRFMDTAFAHTHELFADAIREVVPGAKVGWDGLLNYGWQAGYDFTKLCANLELNQTYTTQWLQGELVRSFKRPGALTGKWGNAVADNEEGFSAWPWDCLFAGDNSVWWWTSWGCDYIPFNPDLSLSDFGKWFFPAAREVAHGPGKLLLHAKREHSGIGVLYSQPDMFVSALMDEVAPGAEFSGTGSFWKQHTALLHGLKDLGCQYQHLSYADLEAGKLPADEYRVLFLSLATCLSDEAVRALRRFVEAGGTLVVDGRAGLLTGDGRLRDRRALDEILGVHAAAGMAALKQPSTQGDASLPLPTTATPAATKQGGVERLVPLTVLEPTLQPSTAKALGTAGNAPVLLVNTLGRGRAVTTNFAWSALDAARTKDEPNPLLDALSGILSQAGVHPPCALTRPDGLRPLCVQQVVFGDGDSRYLALQQDLLTRGLPEQQLHVRLPQPSTVYDVRAGKQVGTGPVAEWDATVSRGKPMLYALLPSQVRSVTAEAPDAAMVGATLRIPVRVAADGAKPAYHVVRMDAYALGSETPHRQYSQNVACPNGSGAAVLPFALNDQPSEWRLVFRDVASGVETTRTVRMTFGRPRRSER